MGTLINTVYFSDINNVFENSANHYHDCHQIIFVTKGEILIYIDGQKNVAKAGDMAITSRLETHSVKVLSDEYERFVLQINPMEVNFENKGYALFLNRPLGFKNIFSTGENINEYIHIFKNLVNEFKSKERFSNQMQEILLNEMLILISRKIPQTNSHFYEHHYNIVADLQRRFMSDCQIDYKLEDLAEDYHISTSSISHQFKKVTGFSIFEYLQSCRIAMAKYYLTKTDLSISEIVEKCGFSDSSNFSRTFKTLTKITPTKFRNEFSSK